MPNPVEIACAWQEAVNRQDAEALLRLSDPNIEIVGPRGVARGHEILLQWLERAGLTLAARRIFARDATVAIAQHGTWRAPASADGAPGGLQGEAEIVSTFQIAGQTVVRYARYDRLDEALAASGLSEADERAFSPA